MSINNNNSNYNIVIVLIKKIFFLPSFSQFRELSVVRYLVEHVLYAQTVLGLVVSKSYVYQIYSIQSAVQILKQKKS